MSFLLLQSFFFCFFSFSTQSSVTVCASSSVGIRETGKADGAREKDDPESLNATQLAVRSIDQSIKITSDNAGTAFAIETTQRNCVCDWSKWCDSWQNVENQLFVSSVCCPTHLTGLFAHWYDESVSLVDVYYIVQCSSSLVTRLYHRSARMDWASCVFVYSIWSFFSRIAIASQVDPVMNVNDGRTDDE